MIPQNFQKLLQTVLGMALCCSLAGCTSTNPADDKTDLSSSKQFSLTSQTPSETGRNEGSLSSSADNEKILMECDTADSSEKLTLTDDLNRTVEFKRPQRIAVLIGSFADELANAGGKDLIVAAAHDTWTQFDLDLENAADLGDVKNISTEALIDSQPDLVIASAKNDSQRKMKETLDNAGIPVLYFDVDSFEDYLRTLNAMTRITGDCQAYQTNGLNQQKAIEEIRNQTPDKELKVLALRETGKGVKALGSENSLLGQMLADLHTQNIAGEGGLDTLSMETVQIENPDAIFYVAQGKDNETAQKMAEKLFRQDAWKDLNAVKEGRVYVLDQKLYNLKPNAKWAQALADLGNLVYGQ